MSKRHYVYSTLTCDQRYLNHAPGGADLPIALGEGVFIKGGAGVANDRLITPRGVATEVTESEVEYLRANQVFQLHEKNGFVMVSEETIDADKAAAVMENRDGSAPIVPQDLPADSQPVGSEEAPAPAPSRKRGR